MNENKWLPKVAIVGRPNVGKSTLFNSLTGTRRALVLNTPGVTRDFMYGEVELWGRQVEVIDTGGVGANELLGDLIRNHVYRFLPQCDGFIVVLDAQEGLLSDDFEMLDQVRSLGKPYLIVVNKVDSLVNQNISDFYVLGEDFVTASFEQVRGIEEISLWLQDLGRPTEDSSPIYEDPLQMVVVGKPNVGKSSLCNRLWGQERALVSPAPGTTQDPLNFSVLLNEHRFQLVDTAGVRRSPRRDTDLEALSSYRSLKSLRQGSIALLVVSDIPSQQDCRLLEEAIKEGKGVLLVVNKWDLLQEKFTKDDFRKEVQKVFHFFTDIPIAFVSAKTYLGVVKLKKELTRLAEKLRVRIPTRELNDFFSKVIRQSPRPVYRTEDVKFYYLTQTKQIPPSFIAFANHPKGVEPAYRKYIVRRMQENWQLQGVPLRLFVMKRSSSSPRELC